MKKVFLYMLLLLVGLVTSQTYLPVALGENPNLMTFITFLTYTGLAYIMFFVGLEFNLDKKNIKSYKTDYIVAFTAATFPWIFSSIYFLFTLYPLASWTSFDAWKEVLFVGRFAAPTSAGILFTMLVSAGLAGTWVYRKIRILAIFDDLDTVLLLIPLKIMVIGMAWQLGVVLFFMIGLCLIAWFMLRKVDIPVRGWYPLLYSVGLAGVCQLIYIYSKKIDAATPIHLEVLFPAFVLGLIVSLSKKKMDDVHNHEGILGIVGGVFMVLVGLNMPYVIGELRSYDMSGWLELGGHVLMITILSNIGKMYVLFNYKAEATFRERLAVGVGMLPRGEVGAGILVMAIGLGFSGKIVTIAMASLFLNLMLTGVFIMIVKWLTTNPVKITTANRLKLKEEPLGLQASYASENKGAVKWKMS